jgi:hypothetical protein
MIGTIRKHSKWLWGIVITVVIITFVFWGAQPGGNSGGRGEFDFGSIAGKPIKREAFADAYREVSLLYFFSAGDWPSESAKQMGFDVEREAYFRLLMLRKVEEAGIHVSDETVARVAGEFLRNFFRGQPVSMEIFEKNVLNRGRAATRWRARRARADHRHRSDREPERRGEAPRAFARGFLRLAGAEQQAFHIGSVSVEESCRVLHTRSPPRFCLYSSTSA